MITDMKLGITKCSVSSQQKLSAVVRKLELVARLKNLKKETLIAHSKSKKHAPLGMQQFKS